MQRKTPRHIRDKLLQIKDKTLKVATENYTSQKTIEWHKSAEWKEKKLMNLDLYIQKNCIQNKR